MSTPGYVDGNEAAGGNVTYIHQQPTVHGTAARWVTGPIGAKTFRDVTRQTVCGGFALIVPAFRNDDEPRAMWVPAKDVRACRTAGEPGDAP